MSHFQSPDRLKSPRLRSTALALIFTCSTVGGLTAFAPTADAAALSAPSTRQMMTTAKLSEMRGADVSTIDWRQPEMKLSFDLTETDWIDGIELLLAMDADGANRRAPVLVSLNNAPPVTLRPGGNGFDARIRLDSDYARPSGNVITIRYPSPGGAACLTPADGGFRVKTAKSSVIIRTRTKRRGYYLNEVEDRLRNPVLAPKTVGIVATGANKDRLQVLAAQGIGLRMGDLPNFRLDANRNDMDIIIGRRDEISRTVRDKDILNETGAKVSVHKGRPLRLVITGDTDAQVLSAAKMFAQRHLPHVRRSESSEGEMRFQRAFADQHTTVDGKTKLSDMGFGYYAHDWRATPAALNFNVTDPTAQSGRLLLRVSAGEKIDASSTLDVRLNGRSLGQTQLDKRRKTVAFNIPTGALKGADNALTLTPTFKKADSASGTGFQCPTLDDAPGFYVGSGSRLELSASNASPVTELSRLTAGSGAFSIASGADTHIVLATGTARDRASALKVAAKLAKASGTGWAEARVSSLNTRMDIDVDRNVLILGPLAKATGLLDDAPRALSAALRGQTLPSTAQNYTREKFASSDSDAVMEIYAARQRQNARGRVRMGGVAAVFPDTRGNGTLTAVIGTAPGYSFATTTNALVQDDTWNTLTGSVARWNKSDVLMAQAAIPAPNFVAYSDPDARKAMPRLRDLATLDTAWFEDGVLTLGDKFDATKVALVASLAALPSRFERNAPTATQTPKVIKTAEAAPVISTKPEPRMARDLPPAVKTRRITRSVVETQPAPVKAAPLPSATMPPATLRGLSKPAAIQMVTREPSLIEKMSAGVKGLLAPRRKVERFVPSARPSEATKTVSAPKANASIAEPERAMKAPKAKRIIRTAKEPFVTASRKWNMSTFERKIRDVQSKAAPMGSAIKRNLAKTVGSDSNPFKAAALKGDRMFGTFGLMLALAFILSVLGLGLASASSDDTKHM